MYDYPLKQRTIGRLLADKARPHRRPHLADLWRREIQLCPGARHLQPLRQRICRSRHPQGRPCRDHDAQLSGVHLDDLGTRQARRRHGAAQHRGERRSPALFRHPIGFHASSSSPANGPTAWPRRWRAKTIFVPSSPTAAPGRNSQASASRCVDIKTLAEASPREPDPELVHAGDPQYIMYTSGTTGPSKGVISPHSQAHGVGRSLAQNYGYRSDDVIFTCLPLFHGNALWYSCYAAFWADCTLAVSPRFSASTLLGRDQGGRRDPVQLARRDDQHPPARAGFAAGPRPPRPPGDDRAAVARILSRRFRALRRPGHLALCDDRNLCGDDVLPRRSRGKGRFGRPAARPRRNHDRQRRGRSAADRRSRRDLRAALRARHHHVRLLQDAGGDRARHAQSLASHRRSRPARRGRLSLFRRPQEGGDPPPRREHLGL